MNNFILKTIKILLCALPLVSIVVADSMFFPFITGKAFLFRVAIELITCLYIALAFADPRFRPKNNKLLVAFGTFVGIIFVADIFAVDASKAFFSNFERMEGFVLLAHLFAYFLVLINVFKEKKDWIMMIGSNVAVSVFMTFFAYLQFFGGAVINQGGVRLDGTLGNSAYMATYMLFNIFFLIYLWFSNGNKVKGISDIIIGGSSLYIVYYLYELSKKGLDYSLAGGVILAIVLLALLKACWFRFGDTFKKFDHLYALSVYSILIIAQIIILYYTATRGAILGLIGGLLLTAIIIAITEKEHRHIKNVSIAVIAILFVVVFGFILIKNTSFVKNSPVLTRFASISIDDTKTQARSIIWPMAIDAFKEKPVLGWGQDNFIIAFAEYYRPEMIRHEPWFDRTHNAFLDWLIAGGILGYIGYLSLYVFALRGLWKSAMFTKREKAVLIGLFSAYAFQNLFIFDNLISYMLFILLLGLSNLDVSTEESKKNVSEEIGAPLLASVVVIFVIILLLVNYRPYEQNITLSQGIGQQQEGVTKNLSLLKQALSYGPTGEFETTEQMDRIAMDVLGSAQVADQDKNDFGLATLDALKAEVAKHPKDVRTYINLGSFEADVGMSDDAIPVLEQAKVLSPKKQQIYFSLAKAYFLKGDKEKDQSYTDKALETLKYAYDLAPGFDAPKLIYAQSLAVTGHIAEGVAIAKTMDNPGDFTTPAVVKIMVENGHADDAVSVLEIAIKADPTNKSLYTLVSDIYTFKKDKAKAIEWLKALEVALPSATDEAEQDIVKVNAALK
ncbi:MAG: hypothetical protein JWP09_406 [Candidatus Taylorbacteria bacterium]|nr:hypothetical protein [Candidatus Taylorbacteria bacterium]